MKSNVKLQEFDIDIMLNCKYYSDEVSMIAD